MGETQRGQERHGKAGRDVGRSGETSAGCVHVDACVGLGVGGGGECVGGGWIGGGGGWGVPMEQVDYKKW